MKTEDFNFHLPESLIAYHPLEQRSASRLLQMNRQTQQLHHGQFTDVVDLLNPGDLLVLNNSKVIPARIYGQKLTGGKIECLVERILPAHQLLVHLRASKAPKAGTEINLANYVNATIIGRQGDMFIIELQTQQPTLQVLEAIGEMPLPPYIKRKAEIEDKQRYQTIYAQHDGSVAAPTAGLHFDETIFQRLRAKQVDIDFVTLHVGAGTFQPVRADNIADHQMHYEYLTVSENLVKKIKATQQAGKRVVAVGSTSVRSLETAASQGELEAFSGDSNIFIYPGYQFQCVDAMITNFHLPKSSLIMMVSAFAGHDFTMQCYQAAIAEQYRFFSYGDAMFIS